MRDGQPRSSKEQGILEGGSLQKGEFSQIIFWPYCRVSENGFVVCSFVCLLRVVDLECLFPRPSDGTPSVRNH